MTSVASASDRSALILPTHIQHSSVTMVTTNVTISCCLCWVTSHFARDVMLSVIMGGAADFKVGYKTGFASGASEKKICTPLFQMWDTSKQISVGAYWIYWNLLSGCSINEYRSKDHFHWTAPVPPVPRWSQKWGTLSPTPPVGRPMSVMTWFSTFCHILSALPDTRATRNMSPDLNFILCRTQSFNS